jgi:cardiolipin synthase
LNLRFLPNGLCVLRMLLSAPVAFVLWQGQYRWTLAIFAVAAVTDGLDGFLAKRFGWTSELGKILDPLADKLLLITVFITLAALGAVPVWVASLAVARDLVITSGAIAFRLLYGHVDGHPTLISKLNTLCQIFYVLGVVSFAAIGHPPPGLLTMLQWVVVMTTVGSGLDYVITYSRRAMEESKRRRVAVR